MNGRSPSSSVTSVLRLTSLSPAAIAVIELRGPQAVEWTMACWEPAKKRSLALNEIRFGTWRGVSRRADRVSSENSPSLSSEGEWGVSEGSLSLPPSHRTSYDGGSDRGLNSSASNNGDLIKKTITTHDGSVGESVASEDIVVCRTDTQTVELHCHGGQMAADRIINDLIALGAQVQKLPERNAIECSSGSMRRTGSSVVHDRRVGEDELPEIRPGSFSVDAWEDILRTTTPLTTAMMLDQAHGALDRAVQEIHAMIADSLFEEAKQRIDKLCSRYLCGLHLTQPWKLAITGPPNAGKSSLLNAILGFDRAIVDSLAGTTRDVLNERTSLEGWPFEILDTAGLRDTHDAIEAEGVRRAMAAIEESDIALCLVDPTIGWTDLHQELKQRFEGKLLFTVSKADLALSDSLSTFVADAIRFSSITKVGIAELFASIVARLLPLPIEPGVAIPFRNDHVAYLEGLRSSIPLRKDKLT
jgi:tRNA modification GTPase